MIKSSGGILNSTTFWCGKFGSMSLLRSKWGGRIWLSGFKMCPEAPRQASSRLKSTMETSVKSTSLWFFSNPGKRRHVLRGGYWKWSGIFLSTQQACCGRCTRIQFVKSSGTIENPCTVQEKKLLGKKPFNKSTKKSSMNSHIYWNPVWGGEPRRHQ